MSEQDPSLNTCGCCAGVKSLTPASVEVRPGLSSLVYRVGTHGSFKASMQSALSGQGPLLGLTTRDDDDPSIALVDAWATVLDVLTFYQERIANEGYLRTATDRRSILEMARSIGYELRPGVAAGTYLAFTLEEAPGSPLEATISIGTKAQSIPGQDESPQIFETVEEIVARIDWNELKPRMTEFLPPGFGDDVVYLKGTSTNLKEGDALLYIGEERENNPGNENWDFRRVKTVDTVSPPEPTADPDAGYTVITLDRGLGSVSPHVEPARQNSKIYALRQQAALFGYNAPDWRAMPDAVKKGYLSREPADTDLQWPQFNIAYAATVPDSIDTVYIDNIYPQILVGSWLVLSTSNYVEVYGVQEIDEDSRTNFTLTAKTTRLQLEGKNLRSKFSMRLRETVVHTQSEFLEMAETPITEPISGEEIVLDSVVNGLEEGHKLIITGKRTRARIGDSVLVLESIKDPTQTIVLESGDELIVMETPTLVEGSSSAKTWHLKGTLEVDGLNLELEGYTTATTGAITFVSSIEEDEVVSEQVELSSVEAEDDQHTRLVLVESLQNIYDRTAVSICANAARATHGETKTEVLGSGDGSQAFQEFVLKQKPLTYISAATPSGTETTLEIRVNEVLWKEAPTLHKAFPEDRVYISSIADDGKVTVQFGDGITGARLPSGVENVVATYRVGTGLYGLVDAQQISMLMTRPLGVKEVINPLAPTGADDPERREQARQNAPLTVLTLDRIVSVQDFEDFARAFAGIGKAQATSLWNGEQRLIHLTVAAVGGGSVDETSDLYENLRDGIDAARHTDQQVQIESYELLTFDLEARVVVSSDYLFEDVNEEMEVALVGAFSFETRSFGQAVTAGEILAIMQQVEGVVAVDFETLNGVDAIEQPRLLARVARWDESNINIRPAQLWIVNPEGIQLTEMKE